MVSAVHKNFVEKSENKKSFGRSRRRWKDDIDMIYLTASGLTPGGSSTEHIYTKQYIEQHNRHK